MTLNSNRRIFMMTLATAGTALAATQAAAAVLEEKDPQAVALGYVADTTKADGKKYPKHDKAQHCANCALWQSKPTDALGNCALFPGKQVHQQGWCSAWAKKA